MSKARTWEKGRGISLLWASLRAHYDQPADITVKASRAAENVTYGQLGCALKHHWPPIE